MRRWVIFGYVAACAILCLWLYLPLLFGQHLNVDLTFMWAGARASDPYDIWAVTRAQAAFRDTSLPQAFVYPPSSLPLFFPFGLLPFWWAFAVWTTLSVVLFWLA